MLRHSLIVIISGLLLSGCLAKQQTILPTSTERETLTNNYMRCVANATNIGYDNATSAETIVRDAMAKCIRAKNAMIREYPKNWQENLVEDVDNKLYQREIAWIEQTRNQSKSGR
jgi:hypothetical protein